MSKKICGAKRQNKNEKCKAPAMENGRCRLHGGATPKGFASPHFVSGKHSKYLKHLPAGVQGAFEENVNQNEHASLIENMALADLHLQELIALLGNGTLFEHFQAIKENVRTLRQVVCDPPERDTNGEEIPRLPVDFYFDQLYIIFGLIGSKTRLYEEIEKANDHVRKLAESQVKIEAANLDSAIKTNNYLPRQFVWDFITALSDVLRLAPEDVRKQQLKLLQEKFDSLPGDPSLPVDGEKPRHVVTIGGIN